MNKYVRVYLVVEGQTEQTFVKNTLAPYMAVKNIFLEPRLLGKNGHKGGHVTFERVQQDIGIFLKQEPDTYITTMVDYFRIDSDWPGKRELDQHINAGGIISHHEQAKRLEDAAQHKLEGIHSKQHHQRFFPYVEMHEFEALLFSDAQKLAQGIGVQDSDIERILEQYSGKPEHINSNPKSAPSKQILALYPAYRKVVMGSTIAASIGIERMREVCPHFHQWLTHMETLS